MNSISPCGQAILQKGNNSGQIFLQYIYIYTHTHTHIPIYIYAIKSRLVHQRKSYYSGPDYCCTQLVSEAGNANWAQQLRVYETYLRCMASLSFKILCTSRSKFHFLFWIGAIQHNNKSRLFSAGAISQVPCLRKQPTQAGPMTGLTTEPLWSGVQHDNHWAIRTTAFSSRDVINIWKSDM